jgi:hypothetical protein
MVAVVYRIGFVVVQPPEHHEGVYSSNIVGATALLDGRNTLMTDERANAPPRANL